MRVPAICWFGRRLFQAEGTSGANVLRLELGWYFQGTEDQSGLKKKKKNTWKGIKTEFGEADRNQMMNRFVGQAGKELGVYPNMLRSYLGDLWRAMIWLYVCGGWGRGASPGGPVIKNLPANVGDAGDTVWSLGQEDPLVEAMATHSSILAWRIPWTEEPGGLQSMGSHRVRHDWVTAQAHVCVHV